MDKLVVNYYEYKHPIINKDLAIGAHGGKKFPTLGAWYDVINEYEFQTRCPIILKNSHRNKHFTFACHLKNCPFKVLLSYAGNAASSETSSPSANNNTNLPGTPDHIHHHSNNMNNEDNDNNNGSNNKASNDSKLDFVTDDLEYHLANTHPDDTNDKVESRSNEVNGNNDDDADANNIFKQQGVTIKNDTEDDSINKASIDRGLDDESGPTHGNDSGNHRHNEEDDVHTQMTKNYSDVVNDEDINVAIANAVANVDSQSNNKHDGKDDDATNNNDGQDNTNNNDHNNNSNINNNNVGSHGISSHSPSSIRDTSMNLDVFNSATDDIPGPFVVTKIEPYHSHPLEDNLSLGKFILTKIPKILQNDLKFDQILESSYNNSNHTVSKFKVSHYVEESGLLDILMQRYGLTAEDFEKRLLSQIARRITTYKARFVLKKKKMGEYNDLQPSSSSNNNNNNDGELSGTNLRSNSIDYAKHQEISSAGTSSNTTKNVNNNKNDSNDDNNGNNNNDASNLMESVLDKTSSHRYQPKKMPSVNKWSKPDQITHSDVSMVGLDESNDGGNENVHPTLAEVDAQEARETAQLAIDKINSYKRSIDDKNGDGHNNSSRNVVDENLINDMDSEDAHKSKRQHLSDITLEERNEDDKLPHEVAEQLRLLSSHLKEVENLHQNNDDDVDDVMVDVDVESQYNKNTNHHNNHHSQPHHDEEDVAGLIGKADDEEDLSDENIQPELRGQ
ncbi:BDN_1c_G0022090.mRNA.1.CDS.1 [Saccharomyces cerevisiae]|nr:BDN_1c_G0022090.mRNA.1.CDS.1 [Saccharomyces cerevisiae]CAI7158932.1 BDN_1c_G0022090.mRNA.1.CDS.1 [Saccharomyces cerevisiae]